MDNLQTITVKDFQPKGHRLSANLGKQIISPSKVNFAVRGGQLGI